ncbi:MAG: lysylphosphatidylglycerol synthase transmembrane domain-containing protein [Oscillochloridaceae bacterium umkhey_bin13]
MFKFVIRILFSVVLISLIITQINLESVWQILGNAHLGWLFLSIGMNIVALLFGVWRWQVVLQGMGVFDQKFWGLFRILMIGTFFSMFLPSSIGGDIAKVVLISPKTEHQEAAATSVLVDRIIGIAVTVGVGLIAIFFLPTLWDESILLSVILIPSLLLLAIVLALFSQISIHIIKHVTPLKLWQKIDSHVLKAHDSVMKLRSQPRSLLTVVAYSVFRQLAICISIFFAGKAFQIDASITMYLLVIPFSQAITVIPIAINGIGLQDSVVVSMFYIFGIGNAEALSLSLFMHFLSNTTGIIGGIIFALSNPQEFWIRQAKRQQRGL